MSLFGGESAASQHASSSFSQSSSEDEDAPPASVQQSATTNETHDQDSASSDQSDDPTQSPTDALQGSDSEAQDSSSSSSSNILLSDRPNRYMGNTRLWRKWTHSERTLISSLDQMRANDLSIHLYNTHSLKVQMRTEQRIRESKPWSAKYRWMDVDGANRVKGRYRLWHPRGSWTAWPLPPERVPRSEEIWGVPAEDGDAAFVSKSKEEKASAELEDVLIGTIMSQARERWDAREWADQDGRRFSKKRKRDELAANSVDLSASQPEMPGSPSRAQSGDRDQPMTDDAETGNETDATQEGRLNVTDVETGDEAGPAKDPTQGYESKPVFMANEEREQHILKPIVRSLHADLDELLGVLHYSAPNRHLTRSHIKKLVWQIRRDQLERELQDPGLQEQDFPSQITPNAGKPEYCRDKNAREDHLEQGGQGPPEQDDMMSDSGTSSTDTVSPGLEKPESVNVAEPSMFERKLLRLRRQLKRAEACRDWSEVLNAAATTGWNKEIIHRAAQRCSALFGENMSFTVLKERKLAEPVEKPIQYTPETVPPLPESDDDDSIPVRWDGERHCIFPKCQRTEPYKRVDNLLDHMRRHHNFDAFEEKKDARVGAVHNDGFLVPVMKPTAGRLLYPRKGIGRETFASNAPPQASFRGPRPSHGGGRPRKSQPNKNNEQSMEQSSVEEDDN